jgi:hypothetical protein
MSADCIEWAGRLGDEARRRSEAAVEAEARLVSLAEEAIRA